MRVNINPIGIPILLSVGAIVLSIVYIFSEITTLEHILGQLIGIWLCYGFLKLADKIKD